MNPTIYKQSDSKVEVKGYGARHYDLMMNIISGGTYPCFIRRVVREMNIQPQDEILDLGCGSGRNICLMANYFSSQGRALGLDIGAEMLEQSQKRCKKYPNVTIKNQRIDELLQYENEFDKVFISFVLHGFIQEKRLQIIDNAQRALRPGGEFIILDYNEFDLKKSPLLVRLAFKAECPLAFDFITRDLQAILRNQGFDEFYIYPHYLGYVRLLSAHKKGGH
ncbi:MAG TPA: class I SAM-dependent methyltransferase [Anaerolineae bacterium]|nr:class I SAM-dependent methyltransferase [Anaerolineae bacterium]